MQRGLAYRDRSALAGSDRLLDGSCAAGNPIGGHGASMQLSKAARKRGRRSVDASEPELAAQLREARAAQQRAERVLDRVAMMAPVILWTYDRATDHIEYLASSVRLLGTAPLVGSGRVEELQKHVPHPEDRDGAARAWQRALALRLGECEAWDLRLRHRDGDWRSLRVTVTPLEVAADGSAATLLGAAIDLTDRRRIEAERTAMVRESVLRAERERRRVAGSVHDGLGQLLPLLRTKLALLRERSGANDEDPGWCEIDGLVVDAHREVSALVHLLSPAPIGELGLAASLQWLAEDVEHRRGLRVALRDRSNGARTSRAHEIALFRATRGALENAALHSGAEQARVELSRSNGALRVAIRDAGRGTDPEAAFARGRSLAVARETLGYLGGSLRLASKPGAGTSVTLIAPLALDERSDAADADGGD
jgi:signal transduction histidine kinase